MLLRVHWAEGHDSHQAVVFPAVTVDPLLSPSSLLTVHVCLIFKNIIMLIGRNAILTVEHRTWLLEYRSVRLVV